MTRSSLSKLPLSILDQLLPDFYLVQYRKTVDTGYPNTWSSQALTVRGDRVTGTIEVSPNKKYQLRIETVLNIKAGLKSDYSEVIDILSARCGGELRVAYFCKEF